MNRQIFSLIILGLGATLTGCSTFMSEDSSTSTTLSGANNMAVATNPANLAPTTVAPTTTFAPKNTIVLAGSIGGNVGKLLDENDNARINQVLETTKTNQSVSWTNAGANATYTVTPTRTFSSPTGEPCRDFTTTAVISGQNESVYSTACRDNLGEWHVVS